jgi:hypothetical protein
MLRGKKKEQQLKWDEESKSFYINSEKPPLGQRIKMFFLKHTLKILLTALLTVLFFYLKRKMKKAAKELENENKNEEEAQIF